MIVRGSSARFLIAVAACIAVAGCDPMIVNVALDGKNVPESVYEYGLAWPFPRDVAPRPVPDELRRDLLALVPLGTSRTEALRKLTDAGIKIERAIQPRREQPDPDRFVANFWNRPQRKVWIVSFGFEFDESHKLRRIDVYPTAESEISERLNPTNSTGVQPSNWGMPTAAIPRDAGPG